MGMQRLPLIGGSYAARSVIANAQRCLNLFPESNRKDSPVPITHYQRPGLVPLVTPAAALPGRAIYTASNGEGYCVIGSVLYYISSTWQLAQLGVLTDGRTNVCSMIDNGFQLIIVDGASAATPSKAFGSVAFAANPSNGDTLTLNGVLLTFTTGPATGNLINIGATAYYTLGNLYQFLVNTTNSALVIAAYTTEQPTAASFTINITYKTTGPAGNAYTRAASAAVPSGASLTGGDGFSGGGWIIDLGDHTGATFTAINDASWTGADRVDYVDTFIIWNQPGSAQFGSTLSNQIVPMDPTYVGAKSSYPDPLQGVIVNNNEIFLPGTLKSELWYDAGNPLFPFARLPGSGMEHGVVAKYSMASADVNVYFLGGDLQGDGLVFRKRDYKIERISNHALEYQIQQMKLAGANIADAIGYTYQQGGHLFYVLSFVSGNQTWVWDESIGDPELGWSQRGWVDGNGTFGRDRGVLGAQLYGKNVVIDWENGTLYEQSLNAYVDKVNGVEYPILYLRTFPHLMMGLNPADGKPMLAEGYMVQHKEFQIDATCGTITNQQAPNFMLRWSDDRGQTWGVPIPLSAGGLGKYTTRPKAAQLGTAMDRVYELSWSFPGPVALNGAWVGGTITGN